MLFNSLIFVCFFFVVYLSYWALYRRYRLQNGMLLVASYVFYGYWDWRFLFLLLISTVIDFLVGAALFRNSSQRVRKRLLAVSVIANLSILGFFKYFNFFAESFVELWSSLGMSADGPTLSVILPVGISFYTFQTLSYTIDIYRGKLRPTRHFADFALFVAFFPQLVAGPIERAAHLLPQIEKPRAVNLQMIDAGLFLILWGYFKKVVIADNVALIANEIFNGYTQYEGFSIIVGVLAFTVQIYCDFSGYSDIARGLCKLMGFDLMVNFRLPYFALNPSDFWLRWHISLSSWLRDYLYIPLGGNRHGPLRTYRNLMITMLLGGLWHGAAWNFVIWGAYHGIILSLYRIFDRHPEHADPWCGQWSGVRILSKMLLMFLLTLIGWVIFRAESVEQIAYMLTNAVLGEIHLPPQAYDLAFYCVPLLMMQIWQYVSGDLLVVTKKSVFTQGLLYGLMSFGILVFARREPVEFIYFQF